jgi:protein tyrosine phosphatase (PTP) superfamily phosphohydrolase (DUF442 family)
MRCIDSIRRFAFLSLSGLAMVAAPALAQTPKIDAPNVVPISPTLFTSGQPSAASLAQLGAQGFGADIYLAPTSVSDAVADEAAIVERQGLVYLNIPINFNRPTEADFNAFAAALTGLSDRKVLVHCQVNMRASSMVFLYRVIVGKESPEKAYESVAKVWSPRGPWKELIVAMLAKHHIAFEPY